jgi:hypothetical protein
VPALVTGAGEEAGQGQVQEPALVLVDQAPALDAHVPVLAVGQRGRPRRAALASMTAMASSAWGATTQGRRA